MAGAACMACTRLHMHACVNKACSRLLQGPAGPEVAPGTAYQRHLGVRKDWLRQFLSVACDASLTLSNLDQHGGGVNDYLSRSFFIQSNFPSPKGQYPAICGRQRVQMQTPTDIQERTHQPSHPHNEES
eukprot:1158729-Pelagomonas_calceolata.AAC.1